MTTWHLHQRHHYSANWRHAVCQSSVVATYWIRQSTGTVADLLAKEAVELQRIIVVSFLELLLIYIIFWLIYSTISETFPYPDVCSPKITAWCRISSICRPVSLHHWLINTLHKTLPLSIVTCDSPLVIVAKTVAAAIRLFNSWTINVSFTILEKVQTRVQSNFSRRHITEPKHLYCLCILPSTGIRLGKRCHFWWM